MLRHPGEHALLTGLETQTEAKDFGFGTTLPSHCVAFCSLPNCIYRDSSLLFIFADAILYLTVDQLGI